MVDYVTKSYFGGRIILQGYRDPVTEGPTKEFIELQNAFDKIANSKTGAELVARISTNLTDNGPRTIWATPQTAADAGKLRQDLVREGSQAIMGPKSYHDTRTGTHDIQRFAGTSGVAVDLDPIDAAASTAAYTLPNVYYGVDGAYHSEAPDLIVFHELSHSILGTIDPAQKADTTPGATVRATNKYALEKDISRGPSMDDLLSASMRRFSGRISGPARRRRKPISTDPTRPPMPSGMSVAPSSTRRTTVSRSWKTDHTRMPPAVRLTSCAC